MAAAVTTPTTTSKPNNGSWGALAKPTGTVDGDLLIFHATGFGTGNIVVPSGFTTLESPSAGGGSVSSVIAWKLASSEPSSYALTNGDTSAAAAGMVRITGYNLTTIIDKHNSAAVLSSTAAGCTGVTPTLADDLVLLFFSATGGTFSNETIATSPPAFTEAYDFGTGVSQAFAYGKRPEVTATGNVSATVSASQDSTACIVLVGEQPDQAPAAPLFITYVRNLMFPFNAAQFVMDLSLLAHRTSIWRNVGKHISTWVGRTKS